MTVRLRWLIELGKLDPAAWRFYQRPRLFFFFFLIIMMYMKHPKYLENSIAFILGNKINIVEAFWPFLNHIFPYILSHKRNDHPKFGVSPFDTCIDTITICICIPKQQMVELHILKLYLNISYSMYPSETCAFFNLMLAFWDVSVNMYRPSLFSLLYNILLYAAAAAKSLQLCLTLCSPIDGSPPGSPIPGILQAGILEWVAISSSNEWKWKVKVKSLSRSDSYHGLQATHIYMACLIALFWCLFIHRSIKQCF